MSNTRFLKMELINNIIRCVLPYSIRKRRYYRKKLKGKSHEIEMAKVVNRIQRNNHVSILFIASSLPMWRYQDLYELLCSDDRFDVHIIIAPFGRFEKDEAIHSATNLKNYFSTKGLNVKATTDSGFNLDEWFNNVNPDLIFYCQQYAECYGNILDYEKNTHHLFGFIPYGLITIKENFVYNAVFHNLAWRVYHPTKMHLQYAKKKMANDAINIKVVGEPNADKYLGIRKENPWRVIGDGNHRKRIIWAPHFSINENGFLNHNSFLWLCEDMVKMAKKYSDKIQIAFKPHPLLYNTLCNRTDWGKERTDEYYNLWRDMFNTQLEEGEFVELFMQSDGMIHDCGSFTGEYMFTRKPVMFMSREFERICQSADVFGNRCLNLHEVGKSIEDVEYFINDIILTGNDPKREERDRFFNECLLPPGGKTVAQNIYDDLVQSLGLH